MSLKFMSNLKNTCLSLSLVLAFPSLMLTPQEQGVLVPQNPVLSHKTCLKLQGMIYQNPHLWTLWVEGEKFTQNNRKSKIYTFEVRCISNDHVEVQIDEDIKVFSIHDSFNPTTGLSCH